MAKFRKISFEPSLRSNADRKIPSFFHPQVLHPPGYSKTYSVFFLYSRTSKFLLKRFKKLEYHWITSLNAAN